MLPQNTLNELLKGKILHKGEIEEI